MTAAYDTYDYPKYWRNRSYEHAVEVVALNKFFSKIKNKGSIIDVGCGHGRLCHEYCDLFEKITLVDPSHKLLRVAKNECDKDDIKYVESTVEKVNSKVPNESYDVALLVRVLHHIDDPDKAFKSINKILKKGGYFIIEFANKIHGKAALKHFLTGDFTFLLDIFPSDRRSKKNINQNSINFLNHHPDKIKSSLIKNGFEIIEKLSVSNVRSNWIKSHIPINILMLSTALQKPLGYINFGPSIFVLAKKK